MKAVKVVILGMAAVGKSAISIRFVQNSFVKDYDPTILNNYTTTISIDKKTYSVDLLDTAGMDAAISLRSSYIRPRDCFVLVYAIDDRQSFEEVGELYNEVLRVKNATSVPCIILGNKCDLTDSREVMLEDGKSLADKYHAQFMEVSALSGEHVEDAFRSLLVQTVKEIFPPETPKKWGICNLI